MLGPVRIFLKTPRFLFYCPWLEHMQFVNVELVVEDSGLDIVKRSRQGVIILVGTKDVIRHVRYSFL